MKNYLEMTSEEVLIEKQNVQKRYDEFKNLSLKINMSRGKPCPEQLDLSSGLLNIIDPEKDLNFDDGIDYRNYGLLEGIPEFKNLASQVMEVNQDEIMVGGNSSLNMMFDAVSCFMSSGTLNEEPWIKQGKVKFLCPVPGYDRHFSICEYFGIQMIPVNMTDSGPDMDEIERIVSSDKSVKGIWCVPKYSNPTGITYSDETVKRLSSLRPLAKDFRIFWDNAYCVHDLTEDTQHLLNIMDECKKNGNEDLPLIFFSLSKITFPGAGVAAMAFSGVNKEIFKKRYSAQIISYDKLNQLRHVKFLKDLNGIKEHMKKHRNILKPKFDVVIDCLKNEFKNNPIVNWTEPKGGYFISVDVMEGCAKRTVALCKEAGLIITDAGATYPYGNDPMDTNIRLAPSYPSKDELKLSIELFCICAKLSALEKIISGI